MDTDIFVQNVKSICKSKGTTPTAACEASGAGRNFMDNIKKGSIPSVAKVQMLEEYLWDTVSELLGEKTTPTGQEADGLRKYDMLNDENRAAIDALIDRLLASQSGE